MVYDFETNGEFGIDEFPCYKLHSIQKINYERSRLKENQDDELVLNTRLKNVLKTTVYLYSYTKEHESIAPEEIHELLNQSQSNIIRGIFNKSKIPIIYCYDRNSRDYKIIIILSKLFALAPNKNNKNKKLKIDDDSSITLRTLFNKLETKSKNLSNTIKIMFKEEKSSPSNSYTIVFNDEEDEDTEQSGPIKTIDEIKEIVQNYSNSLYNLYFYRFEHTEFSTRLRLSVTGLDIINKHNYSIGLYIFSDIQLELVYYIICTLFSEYKDNLTYKDDSNSIYENFKLDKRTGFIDIVVYQNNKNYKILPILISTVRSILIESNPDLSKSVSQKNIDDDFILDVIVPSIADNLIKWANICTNKVSMSCYIIKAYDLISLLTKYFNINKDDLKEGINIDVINKTTIIESDGEVFKDIKIVNIIPKLLLHFKKNNYRIREEWLNPDSTIDTKKEPLILIKHLNNEYYKKEQIIHKFLTHDTLKFNSYVLFNKVLPVIVIEDKRKRYYYVPFTKHEIMRNNDLSLFNSIIEANYNKFTIIYQKSDFSKRRVENFITKYVAKKEKDVTQTNKQHLSSIISIIGEEIFDPDNDYNTNSDNTIVVQNTKICCDPFIKRIDSLNKINTKKLLIVIDSHLMSIDEFNCLLQWIIMKKDEIKNVFFIGCPFMNTPPHKYGQPFVDALFAISPIESTKYIYNSSNISENNQPVKKNSEGDDDIIIDKDSYFDEKFKMKSSFCIGHGWFVEEKKIK
jgi:hypothetical protein